MRIEQHLVAFAGMHNQPKCATDAQLRVGDLDSSKQVADQQTFIAPFGLEGLVECERRLYKGPKDLPCTRRHERMKAAHR
jgi:hypothetical protein